MDLPVMPPVAPMLAKPVAELPDGPFSFEPKWDGFRTIVFRDGDEDDLMRALWQVLADIPAERRGGAQHGARLRAAYTWDAAARDVEQLYLDIAGKRR